MKKICAMVLALCMILSLAGCGGTSGASASAPTADTSVDTSASAETETVTLTFMRTGTPEILHEIFDPMIEEFEKEYPNIKIDMQDLGWSDAEKTLQTMAASETLPDVMYHLPGTIFDLADKGLVLDLTSYVDDELKNDMYPAMLQAGQYDGKQYMITCGGSTIMLWYNTELFEQAGLDPENPPKTWDEFKAACEALSKIDGIDPFGLYAKSSGGETSFLFESLFTSEFGGRLGTAPRTSTFMIPSRERRPRLTRCNSSRILPSTHRTAMWNTAGLMYARCYATARLPWYWTPSIWRTRCPTSWPTARFAAR